MKICGIIVLMVDVVLSTLLVKEDGMNNAKVKTNHCNSSYICFQY